MKKTYLTDATIVSVFNFEDNKKSLLGKVIVGIVAQDETNRFEQDIQIITQTIQSQVNFEFITKTGSYYVINKDHKVFDIELGEFVVMRKFLLSPDEILHLRKVVKAETKLSDKPTCETVSIPSLPLDETVDLIQDWYEETENEEK